MAPIHNAFLAIATLASLTTALSIPRTLWSLNKAAANPSLPLSKISNTNSPPLPTPSQPPKYILLGLGFQNYTCSSASSTYVQSTTQAGAIADLYDITSIATSSSGDKYTRSTLKAFETCLKLTKCIPSVDNGYCETCHSISSAAFTLSATGKHVGTHYFDQISSLQLPNFSLPGLGGNFLSAKKISGAKAPSTAYQGANGLGAVDWLYLVDNGSGRSMGLGSVYRVETAGGVAPGKCGGGEMVQVPYAAEYWFYE
ncbi:hypothetical protein Slin15195_G072400 [Septoria linicola]|uniref:Malate dehydrogenase n=1 Tax=Septoria linicola TaxID=215465 RepID=A0A9Q9B087_9PEZI|nr:hypothetical protein Slin15195_G072400 [Septoria linicola]